MKNLTKLLLLLLITQLTSCTKDDIDETYRSHTYGVEFIIEGDYGNPDRLRIQFGEGSYGGINIQERGDNISFKLKMKEGWNSIKLITLYWDNPDKFERPLRRHYEFKIEPTNNKFIIGINHLRDIR